MIDRRVWHTWILIPLWTIHIYFLLQSILLLIFEFIHFKTFYVHGAFALLCFFICLMLEIAEIGLFFSKKLQLRFYFYSQTFKSSVFSYTLLIDRILMHRDYGRYFGETTLGQAIETFVFYAGLVYALYIWLSYRKLSATSSQRTSARSTELSAEPTAFELPSN